MESRLQNGPDLRAILKLSIHDCTAELCTVLYSPKNRGFQLIFRQRSAVDNRSINCPGDGGSKFMDCQFSRSSNLFEIQLICRKEMDRN